MQAANGLVKVDTRTGTVVWRSAATEDSIMSNQDPFVPDIDRLIAIAQGDAEPNPSDLEHRGTEVGGDDPGIRR